MPFNFKQWIEEHRDKLRPPVGNTVVYSDAKDFIIMVVGGPNSRKDYHYNETEEFFYQLEGDIVVKIVDSEGVHRDIPIREGEIFLLPGKTPHSPQRGAGTVGLVVEKVRDHSVNDGFMWFCEQCGEKLYEEFVPVSDIVVQLPQVFERFYSSPENCTCKKCGTVMQRPAKKA